MDPKGQCFKLPKYVTIIYSQYVPEKQDIFLHDRLLMVLKNDLVIEQWTLSSYKKKQVLENILIQITAQCINHVTLNNVLYW